MSVSCLNIYFFVYLCSFILGKRIPGFFFSDKGGAALSDKSCYLPCSEELTSFGTMGLGKLERVWCLFRPFELFPPTIHWTTLESSTVKSNQVYLVKIKIKSFLNFSFINTYTWFLLTGPALLPGLYFLATILGCEEIWSNPTQARDWWSRACRPGKYEGELKNLSTTIVRVVRQAERVIQLLKATKCI